MATRFECLLAVGVGLSLSSVGRVEAEPPKAKPAEVKPAEAKPAEAKAPAPQVTLKAPTPPVPEKAPRKRASVPLAPTKEEIRRMEAAQKQEPELGAGHGNKRLLGRPFPTSTGNTAGPGAGQGAGTNQDRKATTLDESGPTHGVRR